GYRVLGGGAHGAAHLLAALYLTWFADGLTSHFETAALRRSVALLVIIAGGWLVGSMLMGLYLFISLNVFRRHGNEAFGALRIEGYKNFLRLHIDETGALTIYPIGLDKVPKGHEWREAGESLEPARDFAPKLIEPPIVISARA